MKAPVVLYIIWVSTRGFRPTNSLNIISVYCLCAFVAGHHMWWATKSITINMGQQTNGAGLNAAGLASRLLVAL